MPDTLLLLAGAGLLAAALGWVLAHRACGGLRTRVERAEAAWRDAAARADLADQVSGQAEARLAEAVGRAEASEGRLLAAEGDLRAMATQSAELREQGAGLRERLSEERVGRERAEEALRAASEEVRRLDGARRALDASVEAREAAHREEVSRLAGLRREMEDRFKALADETLRSQGTTFGEANRDQMAALLTPVREQVEAFQKELRQAHEGAGRDRERLKAEIEHLTRRSEEVSREAVALTRALKGDKQKQGAWGEMILERLLEDSGLEKGSHYEVQRTLRDEEGGRWRPDVVVRMPDGRAVVVDAKVSLVAYERAVNADDAEERATALRAHMAAVRRHVEELSGRDYGSLTEGSADYVLMFMPIEGALAAALGEQGDLTSFALRRGVGIMTPTTLMVALRTVEHVWAVERRQGNAEEIARQAGALYDKVAGFLASMESVGAHIDKASDAHEKAMGQLSRGRGNVLRRMETLKEMGAATTKTLPASFDDEPEEPQRIEVVERPSPPREGRGRDGDLALGADASCDARS